MSEKVKILIISNTYYQLIFAIQLKRTLFCNAYVDLWLSDNSVYAEQVVENMKKMNIFHFIKYRKTKEFLYKRSKWQDILDVAAYTLCNVEKKEYELYDEIIFYNFELELYSMLDYYKKKNHKVVWSRYEEGILSYNTDYECGNRVKLTDRIRKQIGDIGLFDKIKNYYCYFPELKVTHREWNLVQVEGIDRNDCDIVQLLNKAFNYVPCDFPQKYIFFASSSDIDGKTFGETELIIKIADMVGKENLLVKMHPRDTRTVYSDYKIATMDNSYVPWEVMQMNQQMSDKVLLTVNSGAFLSISAAMKQETKGLFLLKEIDTKDAWFNERSKEIENVVSKLHNMGSCKKMDIAFVNEIIE